MRPPAPGAVLVLCNRAAGTRVQQTHLPLERSSNEGSHLYRVVLPRLAPGETIDYRLELRQDGRCLATLPADGSWVTLSGPPVAGSATTTDRDLPSGPDGFGDGPLYDSRLVYFASAVVDMRADVIGATPDGYRVNFVSARGRLRGPRIEAVEVDGTDHVSVGPDGIARLRKVATWRTTDGALILEEATGVTDLGPDGFQRIAAGGWTGTPPVTMASRWLSAHPAWQWLTRVQTIATGVTMAETLQLRVDVYLPVLGESRDDA